MLVKLLFVLCFLAFGSQANAQDQTSKSTRNDEINQRRQTNPVIPFIGKRRHHMSRIQPEASTNIESVKPFESGVDSAAMNSRGLNQNLGASQLSERRKMMMDRRGMSNFGNEIKEVAKESDVATQIPRSEVTLTDDLTKSTSVLPKSTTLNTDTKPTVLSTEKTSPTSPNVHEATPATLTTASATSDKNHAIVFDDKSFPRKMDLTEDKRKDFINGYSKHGLFDAMSRPRPASPEKQPMEKGIMPRALKLGKDLDSTLVGAFAGLPPPSNEGSDAKEETKVTGSGANPRQLQPTFGVASRNDRGSNNKNADGRIDNRVRHNQLDGSTPTLHRNPRIATRPADQSMVTHNQGPAIQSNYNRLHRRFPQFGESPQIIHQFQSDALNSGFNRQEPQIRPDPPIGSIVGHSIFVNSNPQDMPRNPSRGRLDKGEGPIIIQRGAPGVDKPVLVHLEDQLARSDLDFIHANEVQARREQQFLNDNLEQSRRREQEIINNNQEQSRREQQFINANQQQSIRDQQLINSNQEQLRNQQFFNPNQIQSRREQQFLNAIPNRLIEDKFGPAFTVIHGGPGQADIYLPADSQNDRRPRPDQKPQTGSNTNTQPDISFAFQPNHRLPATLPPIRPISNIIPNQFHQAFIPTPDQSGGFTSSGRPLPSFVDEPISNSIGQSPELNPFPAFSFFSNLRPTIGKPTQLKPKEKPKTPLDHQGSQTPSKFPDATPEPQPIEEEDPKPVTYRPHAAPNQIQHDSVNLFSQPSKPRPRPSRPRFPQADQSSVRPASFSSERDRPRPIRDELRPHLFNEVDREYAYGYEVNAPSTGDYKTAHEVKGPDGVVRGHYSLVQPDGLIRLVTYQADKANGFRANVEFLPAYVR